MFLLIIVINLFTEEHQFQLQFSLTKYEMFRTDFLNIPSLEWFQPNKYIFKYLRVFVKPIILYHYNWLYHLHLYPKFKRSHQYLLSQERNFCSLPYKCQPSKDLFQMNQEAHFYLCHINQKISLPHFWLILDHIKITIKQLVIAIIII